MTTDARTQLSVDRHWTYTEIARPDDIIEDQPRPGEGMPILALAAGLLLLSLLTACLVLYAVTL